MIGDKLETRTCRALGALGVLLALAAPAPRAEACGGFFTSSTMTEKAAALSDIRVLFVKSPGKVDQVVQVGYTGGASEFAWIYPVPSNPQVGEVKDSVFAGLEELTRPRIHITTIGNDHYNGGGFGCGSASDTEAAPKAGGYDDEPSVKVWGTGQVGAFDYVVITATKSTDLTAWLSANGYHAPAKMEVLDHYVSMGWYFVAMKVSVSHPSGVDIPATTTIRLSYAATEVRYPSRMISLSPAAKVTIAFFLVSLDGGQELAAQSPFTEVDFDPDGLAATSSTGHNYDSVFEQNLARAGAMGMVKEACLASFASPEGLEWIPSGASLARVRTTLEASALSEDIVFEARSISTKEPDYYLTYEGPLADALPLGLVLGIAALRLAARARRRRG